MKILEKIKSQTDREKGRASIDSYPPTVNAIKESIIHHLMSFQGRDPERSGAQDVYMALAYTMRDVLIEKWISTQKT